MWRAYKWSICIPLSHVSICGSGTQTRSVRCEAVTSSGYTNEDSDDHQCEITAIKPRERQDCNAPCVGECVVSEWSEWSKCQQPCTDPNQIQARRRRILRHPQSMIDNSCPILLEERFCRRGDNCFEFSWQMSEWTSCLVNNGLNECGIGHKERHAVCKNHLMKTVDPQWCEEALGAETSELVVSCRIACDVDCLLTEWSPWSDCSHTCSVGVQVRSRAIVQEPMGNGRICPESLEQTKPCFEQGCYTWVVSPWSDCTQQFGICGHGIQKRNITCVGSGGLPVNASKCAPDLDIIVTQTERPCTIPCPGECVLKEWSVWNECFIDCKNFQPGLYSRGVQSRSRAVLANALGKNPPCPEQLWESRPCEAEKCYTFSWQKTDWSVTQSRHVWCERSDGLVVHGGCTKQKRPSNYLLCTPPCTVEHSFCNDTNLCLCRDLYEPVFENSILIECRMENSSLTTPVASTAELPEDGVTNIWMYAVIAAGTLFVIFLAVGCYSMSEFFHKGPRPRKKDEERSIKGADTLAGKSVVAEEVVETQLMSYSHVPPVESSQLQHADSETTSVVSADRTPESPRAATKHSSPPAVQTKVG